MTKILIAEDNRVNQRIIAYTLQKGGYTVVTAANGVEALSQLVNNSPIDLLIADIDMPEMDGITLLRRLRANQVYESLPVLILTASGHAEDYITAKDAGANEVLTKPSSSHELIETVNRIIAATGGTI
ncbi:MAG TPA: response regulator [Anaerolineae bacterium]|nr:response regulator [Anaerolineae bacterium]HMR65256.1 response regulator [Anaerolineae bacterium]